MSLTTMQRAKQAATTRVQNLSLLVQDKDKAMRSMRATVKDLQLEKRVGRASHTIGSVLGGAGAGAAEAFMESTGTETELDVMGVSVPLVGIGAIAVRVAAETMDPSAEGTGMLTSVADGALAYSAGSIAKKLVSSWAM